MENRICPWAEKTDLERNYHDKEWGVPCRNDAKQFEFIVLEAAQAGLSWHTILQKRAGYQAAFAGFDPDKVAAFGDREEEELMQNPGIVRNRLKIKAAIGNARVFLRVGEKYGSFSDYLWAFVDNKPLVNAWRRLEEIPAQNPLSQKICKDLKQKGFKFLGPIVVYSHLQAMGLINDHLVSCFRYQEINGERHP
ncbi:MAG: DNA-3-methyladenine glycosylase I [Desulfarculales bacterium]|jgi:DNA-3-methyladenine glycosylase I|nr:DNA-3-methyladenine glycosylase I [Desulfarculales bacterium]